MMKRFICSITPFLLMLGLFAPSAALADIGVRSTGSNGVREYTVNFTSSDAVNAISDPIPSCLAMTVFWDRGTVGAVSLFETDPDEDTVSEVEASTLVKAFTSTTKFGVFSPTKSAVRFVIDTAETTLPSTARVQCSNMQLASTSGSIEVYSFTGIETVMRAHDLTVTPDSPFTGQGDSVTVSIVLADTFVFDKQSATTHQINLPTGGGDHPQIVIDLNGHIITSAANDALTINMGGASTECLNGGATVGYYFDVAGCNGVAHDYDITIKNGGVATQDDTCDAFADTTTCGRRALVFMDGDKLWVTEGVPYGGRVHLHDLKLGANLHWDEGVGTTSPDLDRLDDACLEVEPNFAAIDIRGGQWDCETALWMVPWHADTDNAGSAQSRISFTGGFRFTQVGVKTSGATSCNTCQRGLLNIKEDMSNGGVSASNIKMVGSLGNTRGGTFDFSAHGSIPGSTATNCWDTGQGTDSYIVNNGLVNTEPINGRIDFSGSVCTRSIIKTGAADAFEFNGLFTSDFPGTFADDADVGANRIPAIVTDSSAELFNMTINVSIKDRQPSNNISFDELLDADILSGAALNSTSSILVDMDEGGFCGFVGTGSITNCERFLKSDRTSALTGMLSINGIVDTASIEEQECTGGRIFSMVDIGNAPFTVSLPAVTSPSGENCCFLATDLGVYTVDPNASDRIVFGGVELADGVSISSSGTTFGDLVCLMSTNVLGWTTTQNVGWVTP